MEPRFYLGLQFGRPLLLPTNQPEPTHVHRGGRDQGYVAYSNSMIEAFWRSLKHQWLYLNSLDTIERLRVFVEFFVQQHNTQMPHPAFSGQTPDEMYFGTAVDLPTQLAEARNKARAERLAANRATTCNQCSGQQASLPASLIPP